MSQRATIVNLANGRYQVLNGEPILDTQEGVLIIAFEDGTSRTINWDFVLDFYYMTAEETERFRREGGR
ncbi:hypothetical protein SEA_KERBEROS_50 [Mycobacterium phage Kerberos]|uniref:HTH_Hin-like protein n=1 Tax=Mycobacterium phage Chy5 TaxID=1327948 RepID=UPI00032B76F5|nr:HTH_Hin-like protein [Mycobacterium phage Chy5]YP_008060204.1 HTH_Hin-like protein [Mycobacterium phage Chy4]AOQ27882.1 hypothetical protein SEA_POMAR16_50 [Mycobacterium phage Pomar16]APC43100.1 hypothetical protein SEA_KERBEROS_50 [Mycobacterium phage Kerberos]APC46168.1 hypothetical protein PBI_STARSTUFF_50 [Mycobacterium phage StarStuff]AXH48912.1 hypothetical protein SEA_TOMATHAN_50 [Mycobacterium phage Tomathan]QBP28708.1 hypothetical protein SEA_DBQU4N_50 [Mycobacterium phage DBQu4n